MGAHDDGCSSKLTDLPRDNSQKTRIINNLRHDLLDGGAGGGGGASYVFLVSSQSLRIAFNISYKKSVTF